MIAQPLSTDVPEDDDRRRKALWLWLAIVAVLVAGLLTAITRLNGCDAATCGPSGTHAGGTGGPHAGNSQSGHATSRHHADTSPVSIQVSGTARGRLAPGLTKPIVLSVANTGNTPARITSADVVVGNASKSCTASDSIRVTHYDASRPGARSYNLIPGAAVDIPLTISMLDLPSNQNACKNASFPLTFHATAQQG